MTPNQTLGYALAAYRSIAPPSRAAWALSLSLMAASSGPATNAPPVFLKISAVAP
jgi:hypothetical protein